MCKSLGEDLSQSGSSDRPARAIASACVRAHALSRKRKSDGQLYHAYLKGHSVTVALHFAEPPCGHGEANQAQRGARREESKEIRLALKRSASQKEFSLKLATETAN